MKIPTKTLSYEAVLALPPRKKLTPKKPSLFFRTLIRALTAADLRAVDFSCTTERMEEVGDRPCLILMNHSSFIDLEIVSKIFYPRPYCIVCTSDGFVGKPEIMRSIGCIPTEKFVRDVSLIGDMKTALHTLGCSVLMYPEASYTFDGCATPLPRKLGILLKKLDVPVVMITTHGAFARDPLYNGLQKRKVKVSAEVRCLLTEQEIRQQSIARLDEVLDEAFTFDNFAWQKEQGVRITEPFRADGLHRILYKCCGCGCESAMEGKGTRLRCGCCGSEWELTELGELHSLTGETRFSHIPDWYGWERQEVRAELEAGTYSLNTAVRIGVMADYKAIYMVGEGRLRHSEDGFVLTGCGGKLEYAQSPLSSYSLYADYFWYEIDDVICIGDKERLYYCFPTEKTAVAKARLAAEEIYSRRRSRRGQIRRRGESANGDGESSPDGENE